MMHIGSLYYLSSTLILLEWKTLKESFGRVILITGPNLEDWVLKPFGDILSNQTSFFRVKNFLS
jgi:hypothetical protein